MTPFSDLLAAIADSESGCAVSIPPDWQQGRTTFGGLSAALCLAAVARANPDLPPLRNAQFTFAGPAGGDVRMQSKTLRRGKSAVFIAADLIAADSIATSALLTFATARASTIRHPARPMPQVPTPAHSEPFFRGHPGPTFMQHFEPRFAAGSLPVTGAADPTITMWLRHRDPAAMNSLAGLIALADGPPPAALTSFTTPAPISTMSWSLDVIDEDAALGAADGWFLLQSRAEDTRDGYSSQDMALWREDGRLVALGRQVVAVFA